MKVKENDKCSYCTDVTADVTEQLVFFSNVRLWSICGILVKELFCENVVLL